MTTEFMGSDVVKEDVQKVNYYKVLKKDFNIKHKLKTPDTRVSDIRWKSQMQHLEKLSLYDNAVCFLQIFETLPLDISLLIKDAV